MFSYETWDSIKFVGGIVLTASAITLVAVVLAARQREAQCHARWDQSGFLVQYSRLSGCLVSQDGLSYIPASAYRVVLE